MIGLFEQDSGHPIQRHSNIQYVTITKNIVFTLRSVSTVGNYDDMFDYTFYLDGSIHVTVRASGYLHDPSGVDFSKFLNGESLDQEDLVLWINAGMHHVPHTGDLPNTVISTAYGSFIMTPLNYLLGDPSRQTIQQARINYSDGNVSEVDTFRSDDIQPACTVDLQDSFTDLWDYTGDVVVRKFPYDPNDPYYETDSIVYTELETIQDISCEWMDHFR